MMKKIILLWIGIIGIVVSVTAQKKKEITTPVTVGYCLPKVSFIVKVKMECLRRIPGPYRQYAAKELGMKPQIMFLNEQWNIKSIEVEPCYLPDEKAVYTLTTSIDYNPVLLSLSPEGFLAGIACAANKNDMAVSKMLYKPVEMSSEREVDITSLNTYNPLKEVLDTNYTYQEIDGVMKKIWDPIVRYTAKQERDNVTEAVKEIFRIRSERVRLINAENGIPDGESLEVILKEFDRMEQDYLSLFMGKEEKQEIERSFICTPEKEGEAVVAFRFRTSEGIVPVKDVSAEAYSLVADHVFIPSSADTPSESTSVSAIYYRVPAMAEIKLMRINEKLQSFYTVVPQLGLIKSFSTDVISGENLTMEFYPQYGSIKSINRK